MCCLKYEDDAYKDLRKDLPKMNATVDYEDEKYRITSMNLINKTCKLENSEHAIIISLEDLKKYGKYIHTNKEENTDEETVEQ